MGGTSGTVVVERAVPVVEDVGGEVDPPGGTPEERFGYHAQCIVAGAVTLLVMAAVTLSPGWLL